MRACLSFLCLASLFPTPLWASEQTNESGTIALIATPADPGHVTLGLHFDLKPGWKIYWRLPGDAGYPPTVAWAGSTNIAQGPIEWPAPQRFVEAGLQSIGYHGRTVLPIGAAIPDPTQGAQVTAQVEYLACAKVCVPMSADLALDIEPGGPTPDASLTEALAHLPRPIGQTPWHLDRAELTSEGATDLLRVEITAPGSFTHPDLFIEDGSGASFAVPEIALDQGGRHARITTHGLAPQLRGKPLDLTLTNGSEAAFVTVTPAVSTPAADPALLSMAAIAFLGGLILNLMPCVLPILSLKVLAVIRLGGAERAHARSSFLASSAGILASFLGLALLLIGLKLAGHRIGWGLHFQQPLFLGAMMAILLGFAANLWGLFHIPLPSLFGQLAMDDQGRPIGGHGLAGHFLSGLFATLLATPCSAPFVGTAIGFALARGPQEILLIFGAMGLGLAGPFLTLAAAPALATSLPRPGPWIVLVTRGMGLALAATALWLGTILFGQLTGHGTAVGDPSKIQWTAFDQAEITKDIADGKVVFVDVTADWCISCKVNKAAVIERGDVAARLMRADVVAMQADWTSPSEVIAHYLEQFGRFGIPFNAVYGPGAPEGIALSELPGSTEILDAIGRAKR